MRVICQDCRTETDFDPRRYRCECGGPWEPPRALDFDADQINTSESSLWRYKKLLNDPFFSESVYLAAGWTPILTADWGGAAVLFKLEYLAPTGSFKDRGTEVEMTYLKAAGVENVVEDSSGNAGASMAAYAARAGLNAGIYAPESASPAKLIQIEVYGARLHSIPGPRIEATRAVLATVDQGAVYASHAYNPVYALGQQTFAWEIWEQTGGDLPDAVVVPAGQGGLLLGAWFGFLRLLNAGLIKKIPRLFSAQSAFVAPISKAFHNASEDISPVEPNGVSIAEGIAITRPVRGRRILEALRESGGGAIDLSEAEIHAAYQSLAHMGIFAEPTSAVAAAAVSHIRADIGADARVLVGLSGSGLKSPGIQ